MPQHTGEPECVRQNRASRAARTAYFIAAAIRTGSSARVTAETKQHGVATELDGAGRFGSRADARIEYDRDSGVLDKKLDVVRIADAET